MRIASVTAGAAGMVCGSCLRDNTLAAALVRLGHDCRLIPTFTPLTLDEPDHSDGRVFLGGVNIYLDEYRFTRWVPHRLRRWLDRPWVLRLASRLGGVDDYSALGEMTLSMLCGGRGRQRDEFAALIDHLRDDFRPDVVLLTNVLLSGLAPLVRDRLGVPVVATLQGDDIFLNALSEPQRTTAISLIRDNGRSTDGYVATSRYYADFMAGYLGIDRERIGVVYPGINPAPYTEPRSDGGSPTVGYFARVAPEKGLHVLAEAFLRLQRRPGLENARLRVSGWLGPQHGNYFDGVMATLRAGGAGDVAEYVASPGLRDKARFLASLDVFSVPTTYREPKGLYVLEAMAAGVPVVQPTHGSFPELVEATGGGVLVPPDDPDALADGLAGLLLDPARRHSLGAAGRAAVRARFNDEVMARSTAEYLGRFVRQEVS
jgi:glycosyltransferase involved in cell wall biosynthesis